MDPQSSFSVTYVEAREKFLAAARDAEAEMLRFQNPQPGPSGESLTTDVAVIGNADAEAVLICNSATHGVEGFGGSGIQVGLLRSGVYKDLPDNVLLVLSHALNPHGFASERRVTEGNVDLNRNFQDFGTSLPENPDYPDVHDLLLPEEWDGPSKAEADRRIQAYIETNGHAAYQAAVTRGQYSYPDGLFYGGDGPTWSNATWRGILARFARGRARVATIDLHTGLGPSGHGEAICGRGSVERARAWYGDDVTSPQEGSSSSAVLTGFMAGAVAQEAPDAEATSITLEFGTLPFPDVIEALRGDHWLYRGPGPDSPLAPELKRRIRAAFYVETPVWKESLWARADEITRKAFQALGA